MGSKQVRQAKIRELLQNRILETHEGLAAALQEQDVDVSQSTLPKDLRELGVVRAPRPDGGFRYTLPEIVVTPRDRQILERELRDYLLEAKQAGNLVVVRTISGHAQSVCEAIDRIGWSEIAGTIAGENTIFIASATGSEAAGVVERIAAVRGEAS